ncbi:hypothetical protein ACWJJH_07395 [Endozoicomonadaceae bacterium StTr2]
MKTLILIALAAAYSYGISAGGAKFSREIEVICGIQIDDALGELFFNDTVSKEKEDLAGFSLSTNAEHQTVQVSISSLKTTVPGLQQSDIFLTVTDLVVAANKFKNLALMSGSHSLKVRADRERRDVPAGTHEVELVLDVACI